MRRQSDEMWRYHWKFCSLSNCKSVLTIDQTYNFQNMQSMFQIQKLNASFLVHNFAFAALTRLGGSLQEGHPARKN